MLPVEQSMPVTLNCTKKLPGALFGWRVHLTDGSFFFITNDSSLHYDIKFTANFVDTDVTTLEFEFDESLVFAECQFFGRSGSIIRSDKTYFLIVSKFILVSELCQAVILI